ncbi:MAG TPA: 6-phosphofructo-2-kinase/fructose-2,6-bisphosphatase [Polyangiaceae bacterium]|nr:6-phosphofructo-2-kinase/fructose-2,6-bisphosphatase [Polyangiaceae bacterium]
MAVLHGDNPTYALVMVGLPARGKTYVARKIMRYLNWLGHKTTLFNVGNYRREHIGSQQTHAFFDPQNAEGVRQRTEVALMALEDMLRWFAGGGEVAIYDATNSTRERRALIRARCEREGVGVIFIESLCDEATVEANVRATKLDSPDYQGMDPDLAVADFRARIEHYARVYEPVDEGEGSYIKLIDVGRQLHVNMITGYLPSRLVSFLVNLHNVPRPIWLTRHGQAEYNVVGRIGGNTHLSELGTAYAHNLKRFYDERIAPAGDPEVWTSTLVRTHETAVILGRQTLQWRALNEIEAGVCDGLTYAEIKERYPEEWRARSRDKLGYRYPQGESYMDVIQRVEPVVLELERQRRPILIISHQAVLRAIYGYLMGREPEQIPHLSIPLHTVLELTPKAYGSAEQRFALGPGLPEHAGPSS